MSFVSIDSGGLSLDDNLNPNQPSSSSEGVILGHYDSSVGSNIPILVAEQTMAMQEASGGSRGHETPNRQTQNHQQSTLKDLTGSWVLLVLRVYHCWLFLLSLVFIAGFTCNFLLNLFVYSTQHGHFFGNLFCWNVLTLFTQSKWIELFITGMMQHGVWLLEDSIRLDMFKSYRRTWCCEGPGIDFAVATRTICLQDINHKNILYAKLTDTLQVTQDIGLDDGGRPSNDVEAATRGARLPARSQFLEVQNAVGPINAKSDIDRQGFPVELKFRLPKNHRSADFSGLEKKDQVRACVDVFSQVFIFVSIDIFPIVTAAADLSVVGIVSLEWINGVVTTAISVCIGHILIYYLLSTIQDYYWKAITFRELAQGKPSSQAHINSAVLDDRAQQDFGYVADGLSGSIIPGVDNSLNVFVRIRDFFLRREVQWVMMGLGVFLLLLCTVLAALQTPHVNSVIISGVSGFTLIVIFVRFLWCAARQQTARQLVEDRIRPFSALEDRAPETSKSHRIFWFLVNCSFDWKDIVVRYFVSFLATIFLMLVSVFSLIFQEGVSSDFLSNNLEILLAAVLMAYWCTMVMAVCLCYAEFWKFMLAQYLCFAFVSVLLSAHFGSGRCGWTVFWTIFFMLAAQFGMSRHGRTRSHVVFLNFFTIYITIIAAIAFTTAADDSGLDIPDTEPEWCEKKDGRCKEYEFPLYGLQGDNDYQYSFCGLSWPMGVSKNDSAKLGTVSERCSDTRLTLADFGHFARLPYLLPNETAVNTFMDKYLPGWDVQKPFHHFTVKGTSKTTFVHIRRHNSNTSVVAIRGTSSVAEIFQDVNFWMPSAFLQVAQILGPSLFNIRGILPFMTGHFPEYRDEQIAKLMNYTRDLTKAKNETVYVTGHSLGGGLATMVGGMLNIPAVTFSAPGIGDTSAILDPQPDLKTFLLRLRHIGVNVVPDGDAVPQVDKQSGMVVPLDCNASALDCHALKRTMCKILAACGDGGGRKYPRHYKRSCQGCGVDQGNLSSAVPNSGC